MQNVYLRQPIDSPIGINNLILIGSNDETITDCLVKTLNEQYQLTRIKSGMEALRYLENNKVALILFDLDLLDLDGILAAKVIKNRQRSKHIPLVIIHTQVLDPQQKISDYQGCIEYILKPGDAEILSHKIRSFIQIHEYLKLIKNHPLEVETDRYPYQKNDNSRFIADRANESQFNGEETYGNNHQTSKMIAASLVHEIKNPMTTIRALLELSKLANKPIPQNKIDIMIQEIDRISAILTDFLDLNKSKSNKKLCWLGDLINSLDPLLSARAASLNKTIVYKLTSSPEIYVNACEIFQLVLNLALNGLEAMETQGQVLTISTSHYQNMTILAISDQGPGIEPQDMDKIWAPFYTSKTNGTGLGLSICQQLAFRNQAFIDVISDRSGTTFYVHFPCIVN